MDQPDVEARLRVATPVFEGPLELLLALAEREDVDILQVPLARLTDSYLAAIAELPSPDPAEMAGFLWTLSRLLLLKSIRLLPGEEPGEEEVELLGWEEDVRQRLEEYRRYKEVARGLMERATAEAPSFPSPARTVEVEGQEAPLEVELLVGAFKDLLTRLPPRPVTVAGRAWTTEHKVEALTARLLRGSVNLVDLILDCEDRLEAVVTFVALLELLRQGRVGVRQKEAFGDIIVEWRRQ
ncbi:MAG TPA: segregation/condensation protein A [Candidatus Dormibacteraeota bacterium]|nr:segregation/condensation protein A [Candidatus Dormibacteraeota bacterium]